jgi:competence protein ComEA
MTIKKVIPLMLLAFALSCGAALAEDGDMLNVNSATAEQLVNAVPGLSPELAQAIVSYREDMGDIQDMNELLDVDGMTKDTLEQVKKRVGLEALSGAECSC